MIEANGGIVVTIIVGGVILGGVAVGMAIAYFAKKSQTV